MDANANIEFGLKSVAVLLFEQTDNAELLDSVTPETLGVQFITQTLVERETGQVGVKAGVKYVFGKIEIFRLETLTAFEIKDIASVISIDRQQKRINFSVDIVPTFLNVAIGTLRGILVEKMAGTPLGKYPLPLIDSNLLVERNTFHLGEVR